MTAMLGCDGCGTIVQDRGADEARTWLALTVGPSIGEVGLLPSVEFGTMIEPALDELDPEPLDLEPIEPTRHFCSLRCLGAWASRAEEAGLAPPIP